MRRTARLLTGTALAVTTAGTAAAGTAVAGTAAAGLAVAPLYGAESGAGELDVHPAGVLPGAEVTVGTAACGTDGTAAGDASAVGAGTFTLAPDPRRADATGRLTERFEVPPSARPGTYQIVARCSTGGREVTGDLVVTLAAPSEQEQVRPRGSVKTGVGGALGPDPVQTAAGVAALAVAAAGGTWLLHRRARGDGF